MTLGSFFGCFLLLLVVGSCFPALNTIKESALEPIHLFAVGFDLTDSYGTASLRLADGRVQLAARVDGENQYLELMQRLALNSSRHMSPPYEWWHDGGVLAGWDDYPRQMLRRARKSVGLPASPDVGVLSTMLSALREETEQALADLSEHSTKITVDRIMLTTLELPALYDEDINDAALHSRLELLQTRNDDWHQVPDPEQNKTWTLTPWISRQPKHSHALFAAHSLAGNLYHPISPSADPALMTHSFLLVHLTRHGLELGPQIKKTNRTCNVGWGQHMSWYNGSLGWPSSLPMAEWRRGVAEMVRIATWNELLNHYQNGPDMNITDVIFAGESGALPALREIVLDYVRNLPEQSIEVQAWPHADAEDLQGWVENGGSYGAAMMAWQFIAEEPLEGDVQECWSEMRRNDNYGSQIRYLAESERFTTTTYQTGIGGVDGQQILV